MIIIADNIAAKIVKKILEEDNNIDSVIGLSSMSLSVVSLLKNTVKFHHTLTMVSPKYSKFIGS